MVRGIDGADLVIGANFNVNASQHDKHRLLLGSTHVVVVIDDYSEVIIDHVTCQHIAAASGKIKVILVKCDEVLVTHNCCIGCKENKTYVLQEDLHPQTCKHHQLCGIGLAYRTPCHVNNALYLSTIFVIKIDCMQFLIMNSSENTM